MENNIILQGITSIELANLISENIKLQIESLVSSSTKEQPKEENDFLTRKETSKFLKVSLVSVHQWVKDGLIKPYKVGNRTYFKKSELITVIESSNRF